jgi:hypothetical protein
MQRAVGISGGLLVPTIWSSGMLCQHNMKCRAALSTNPFLRMSFFLGAVATQNHKLTNGPLVSRILVNSVEYATQGVNAKQGCTDGISSTSKA